MNQTACASFPIDRTTIVHLDDQAGISSIAVDDQFWSDRTARPELRSGHVVAAFDYDRDWTWWERHRGGEELVCLLSGGVDLLLDSDGIEHHIPLLAGRGALVPRNAWHSVDVREPSRMLFVTPAPAQTVHRDR